MRKIITLLLFLSPAFYSHAQFNGILHYVSKYNTQIATGTVYTTCYISGKNERVESRNVETKSAFGSPKSVDQNVLIYDFSKQKETHIVQERRMATIMNYITVMEEHMMQVNPADITVENAGQEKVENYSCTHYTITQKYPKIPNRIVRRDVWVSQDLGGCNLFYVGSYLYYPKGSIIANKLLEAGGNGVVVKWSEGGNSAELTSVEKSNLPASTFQVPSGFTVMQR